MGAKVTELQPRQTAAIVALLKTGQVSDAAKAGNVTAKTIYAWLRQPAFVAALRAAEAEALRGLALVKNNGDATLITGGGGIVWRGGANPKLLADDDVLTLLAYIKSLGGWDRPGHWVEGVKSAGASFNVQPWFVHG